MLKKDKRARTAADLGSVSVLPAELRVGDRFTDDDGVDWELITQPTIAWLGGKRHRAQVRRVRDPAMTRQVMWQFYRPVMVRPSDGWARRTG